MNKGLKYEAHVCSMLNLCACGSSSGAKADGIDLENLVKYSIKVIGIGLPSIASSVKEFKGELSKLNIIKDKMTTNREKLENLITLEEISIELEKLIFTHTPTKKCLIPADKVAEYNLKNDTIKILDKKEAVAEYFKRIIVEKRSNGSTSWRLGR